MRTPVRRGRWPPRFSQSSRESRKSSSTRLTARSGTVPFSSRSPRSPDDVLNAHSAIDPVGDRDYFGVPTFNQFVPSASLADHGPSRRRALLRRHAQPPAQFDRRRDRDEPRQRRNLSPVPLPQRQRRRRKPDARRRRERRRPDRGVHAVHRPRRLSHQPGGQDQTRRCSATRDRARRSQPSGRRVGQRQPERRRRPRRPHWRARRRQPPSRSWRRHLRPQLRLPQQRLHRRAGGPGDRRDLDQ